MQAKVSEEPESMLWSELEDRQLRAPERQLLDGSRTGSSISIWSRSLMRCTRVASCCTPFVQPVRSRSSASARP